MPKLVHRLRKPYKPLLPPCANQYLLDILSDGMRVFEWGAGSSTLWFAQRGCVVTSVEHDREWADHIRSIAKKDGLKVDLIETPKERFPEAVSTYEDETFDLVFVDCWSHIRNACMKVAVPKVRDGGWILLDDTQWAKLTPSIDLMNDHYSIEFYGIVHRRDNLITKRNISNLHAQAKVEVTKCTLWQK